MASRLARKPEPAVAAFAGIFAVTVLGLLSVGAVIPVLPRYVKGPLDEGDVAVGFVVGAFAFTGLAARPLAGHLADLRGRRVAVVLGSSLAVVAGLIYFIPAGLPGLIASRFALGAGEGTVFTAGAAWVVDLAPVERRGRMVGLYGLAVWTGLSLGPPIGDLLLQVGSYELVWAFATAAPLLGLLIALRLPDPFTPAPRDEPRALIARESLRPGIVLSLGVVGFAAIAAFIALHLEERGIGHGTLAFTVFAVSVVVTRLAGGDLPDRIGAARCALGAAAIEALGLIVIALAPEPRDHAARRGRDGRRFLDPVPGARPDRRRARARDAPRLRRRHVHGVLRHRGRAGGTADRRRRRSRRRLRGRVLGRGGLCLRRRGGDRNQDQNSFGCPA